SVALLSYPPTRIPAPGLSAHAVASCLLLHVLYHLFFIFTHPATADLYTLSLHDALPIFLRPSASVRARTRPGRGDRRTAPPVRMTRTPPSGVLLSFCTGPPGPLPTLSLVREAPGRPHSTPAPRYVPRHQSTPSGSWTQKSSEP